MKIAVTGALGHIGSRLIRELPVAFPGTEISMLDNMATQRYASLFNLPTTARYRFVEGDVLSHDLISLFDGVDAVIHLAAITNAAGSFEIKDRIERENYECTKRVAEACLKVKAPLIHLSSTSVYGTQKEVVDENCSEEELSPQSPYAATKIREEQLLKRMYTENGLANVICRFGTIFGVSPGMRFHTAVNKFCWQAVLGQPLTVWTSAYRQQRPYLDLGDAIRSLVHIIRNGIWDGEIYNVLTHNLTVCDVVDTIREHIRDLKIDFVEHEIMNQLSYSVSCEKFRCRGFEFRGNIRSGVAETLELLGHAN